MRTWTIMMADGRVVFIEAVTEAEAYAKVRALYGIEDRS